MNEETRKVIARWLNFAGLVALVFLALTVNIEIFCLVGKGIIGGFFAWVAALNLIAEGFGIYLYGMKYKALTAIYYLFKKENKEVVKEQNEDEEDGEKIRL